MMKKLGLSVNETLMPAPHPLSDWALHLYRYQRTQYIISTNTSSLFSFIFAGRGITDEIVFKSQFVSSLREHHQAIGMAEAYNQFIDPDTGHFSFSKVGNRSVTGSMNELILQAMYLQEERNLTLPELSLKLNHTLLSAIDYQKPIEAHRKLRMF